MRDLRQVVVAIEEGGPGREQPWTASTKRSTQRERSWKEGRQGAVQLSQWRQAGIAAELPGVVAAAVSASARALPDAASAAGWAPEPGESASGVAPELCVSAAGPPSWNERKGAKSARQNQDHQRRRPCCALADAEAGAGRHWKKAKQERTTAGHRAAATAEGAGCEVASTACAPMGQPKLARVRKSSSQPGHGTWR